MVKAWREDVVIPTYECGSYEKNPIFLEKRVYQGSSGVVYPYPVIESIADEKSDHTWHAVWLENEYLKIMLLPELGGRVQMAYDKVRERHFVYYNSVVKPALVGLAGPWISGGIEFNWPQHHRPSTYMPVDCDIRTGDDGSVTVWMNEQERMFGQKGTAAFTLRPGCAYLEIEGRVSNPTSLPQTFLWWANPAVFVNDYYRSVFPPDINAVFDHGKRAVSTFPIATGTYYKMDYSAGVDIANYKNIKVPTSYMGVNSTYDFEGGYENDTQGGMLHVASHHYSPGKKQWTWGNGDFGRAWDRNLTDNDGPYIELMAGVYTENQPDFSWLMPCEQKHFRQYFMPYHSLPDVKNASKDFVLDVEPTADGRARILVYATAERDVLLSWQGDGADGGTQLLHLTPAAVVETLVSGDAATLCVQLLDVADTPRNGRVLLSYRPEPDVVRRTPDAAEAPLSPADTKTVQQLYLTGLHLEQYRHATWNPLDYYEEALRRDPDDVSCNTAMGRWYVRRGRFDVALPYLQRAVKVLQKRNPNPYEGEALYLLALAHYYLGNADDAYRWFWKATWNAAWAAPSYLHCALISMAQGRYEDAVDECDRCLGFGRHVHRAYAVKACALRLLGDDNAGTIADGLRQDPFNYGCLYEQYLACGDESLMATMKRLMRGGDYNYDMLALHYQAMGRADEAAAIWHLAAGEGALSRVSRYHCPGLPDDACPFFPNRLEDIAPLRRHADAGDDRAAWLLGCLYYDKRQYDLAVRYWQLSADANPAFPTVWRCLALYKYNKEKDADGALRCMRRAFELDESDSRVLMELDQLCKVLQHPHAERLACLLRYPALVAERDDLSLEVITLLNQTGRYAEAMQRLDARIFHPWEGGEGKVPLQYQTCRVELAKQQLADGKPEEALELLQQCLQYPHHLGEGKLYGAQENDFYFLMGLAYEQMGRRNDARDCWQHATEGPTEPAAAMYYNDAKPEKIFYLGLALRKLAATADDEDERRRCADRAAGIFHRLVNYGENHLFDEVKMDYFAVSLPDLLIWDGDLNEANVIHCHFMIALGRWGLGDGTRALRHLQEAEQRNANHQGIQAFKTLINQLNDKL